MTSQQEENSQPEQLPVAPNQVRAAALAELARLTSFVHDLSLDHWKKPNVCGEWTMGDVVTHLNLILRLHNQLISAVIAGRGSGSVWKRVGQLSQRVMPAASPALNAINSALPRVLDRAFSPEVVKGQSASASRSLNETLTRVGPEDYTRPVYYQGGPWPLSFLLAALVDELAVHGWDMASKLDPHAHLSEDARTVLPSFFWSGTPFMLRLPKQITGSVQASLTDPAAEMWWTISDTKTTQGLGRASNPDVTLSGMSGTFVLALAGRIRPEEALRSTSLTASGKEDLARVFLGSWRIL